MQNCACAARGRNYLVFFTAEGNILPQNLVLCRILSLPVMFSPVVMLFPSVMAVLFLLYFISPFASSLSSVDRCSGTYYQRKETYFIKLHFPLFFVASSCPHRIYSKFYYDSFKGSCESFTYKECINNPNPAVSHGSGNPYNKFDSIDECQRTCFRKAVIIMLNCYYV